MEDKLTVAFDIHYTNWAYVDDIEINLDSPSLSGSEKLMLPLRYENTVRFNLGGSYKAIEDKLDVFAGYYYDPTPIPEASLRPTITDVNDKHNISLGGRYYLNDKISCDLYYEFLFSGKRDAKDGDLDDDGVVDNIGV